MDKIEIGEYVRGKNGLIGTLIEISKAGSGVRYAGEYITDNIISIYTKPHTEVRIKDRDIVKHSKNIIDLIEEGDYVNGMLVTEISKNHKVINICSYNGLYASNLTLVEADIKNVVTKEQFNRVKYEVEGEK